MLALASVSTFYSDFQTLKFQGLVNKMEISINYLFFNLSSVIHNAITIGF